MGVEPTSSAWKAEVIAIIRHPLNKPFLPAARLLNKEFLATFQQPAPASCKSWWRGEDYYGLLPSTLRVVAKNATLEIAPGDFPEPLIGSNPPLSPEGVFSHFSVACTCLVQIMVEGGGFEPPKSKQQIYSLPPLAAREPLRKLEAAYFA